MGLMQSLEIWYLYNSGFLIKFNHCSLIFDYYWEQSAKERYTLNGGVLPMASLCQLKNPYVFVSHGHKDHYNPVIFKWKTRCPNLRYIISADVRLCQEVDAHLRPLESYRDDFIAVKAYDSTDEGVSFAIDVEGYRLFFAGDFNFWHWKEESTEAEVKQASLRFLSVMKTLRSEKFDVVFFPVDPRMGDKCDAGALYFAKMFQPKLFIPMHFREDTSVCQRFAEKLKIRCPGTTVWVIRRRGQKLIWPKKAQKEGKQHVQ